MSGISVPQIQIRQTPALIGIDADLGQWSMRQPKADVELRTIPSKLEMHQPAGTLEIDQSRAWDALGLGNNLETMHHIYSEARNVAMQGIARIVEKGNRLAAIHLKGNPIADIGQERAYEFWEFNYTGEASFDNVDIQYTAHKPEIEFQPAKVDINVTPRRPEVEYNRGKLDIYMRQYNSLEITPPQIDLHM